MSNSSLNRASQDAPSRSSHSGRDPGFVAVELDGDEVFNPFDDDDWDDPVDLGPAWRGEKKWPEADVFKRTDAVALLLPGINYMFGDSGDGKSFVALIASLEELRAGHWVIWITYEDANEELIVSRLKLLGATEDEVSRLLLFTPQTSLSEGIERITDLAILKEVRLLVLDSTGEAMAVDGTDEDRDKEVGPWFRETLRQIHNAYPSLAILPIDHSTKSKDNALFPSGSKRKRAMVTGRSYLLKPLAPFAAGEVGWVALVVSKDRTGRFKRGDMAAIVTLNAFQEPYVWTVTAPTKADLPSKPDAQAQLREKVSRYIEDNPGLTANKIATDLGGRKSNVLSAINWLKDEGIITETPHYSNTPYRAGES